MSRRAERRRRRRRIALLLSVAGTLLEAAGLRRRGYSFAGEVIVRCGEGHLYTTIWIPGVSLKSLRMGLWRFQRWPGG